MKRMMFFACMLTMGMTALAQNVSPSADWKEIQPKEITINPINLYQDWIVLAVNNEEKPNAMLLTMGTMGVFRGKPIVSIFVNESRYTYGLLQKNPYFTLAVFPEQYKESVSYLGHHSGRDGADKIKDAGLEVSKTELGNPFFEQANLVIECRMIYTGVWDESKLDDSIKSGFYRDGERRPAHQQFMAEIVHVWTK
jgi:flavin reductase (DIM6/NTAB) family NADH-FMN oxidoreductase RutF